MRGKLRAALAGRLRGLVQGACALAIFLMAAAPAWAQEAEKAPENSTVGWIFRWLNFALVFGGGGYLIAKKAPTMFRRRAEAIVSAITEAARVKEDAERRRRDSEAKLAGLDGEIAELRAMAMRDAGAEAERIRELARDEAKKIERAAEAEIQAAERAARLELKMAGADLAIARAEALLRKELTPAADSALIRGFVTQLAGSAN